MTHELGVRGEKLAKEVLENKGYKIITANYKTKLGEIDLIARDKDTLVFIEVRAKSSTRYGLPQETVNFKKQKKIRKVATQYMKYHNLYDLNCRFDVVGVVWKEGEAPKVTIIKDAF